MMIETPLIVLFFIVLFPTDDSKAKIFRSAIYWTRRKWLPHDL